MVKEGRSQVTWVDSLPEIKTERLLLRIARRSDVSALVAYLVRNADHLQRWEPRRAPQYFTEAYWRNVPEQEQRAAQTGEGYRFRAFLRHSTGEYVGNVSLRDVIRYSSQFCTLGYSVDSALQGRGLATEMSAAAVEFAFNAIAIRRIEACYMPANVQSARVLAKLGFEREGLLRGSLLVNGKWEDHVLCSLINEDWREPE